MATDGLWTTLKALDETPREPNDVRLLEEAAERGWTWILTMDRGEVSGVILRAEDVASTLYKSDGRTLRSVVVALAAFAISVDNAERS